MEDLSARYPLRLVPTSQDSGNMSFDNSPAMTAPGSVPVTPLPEYMNEPYGVPEPGAVPGPKTSGPQVPLSSPKPQPAKTWRPGGGSWHETPDANDQPHPSPQWQQL